MASLGFTFEIPQVEIGDRASASDPSTDLPALLHALSVQALTPGLGVYRDPSTAIGTYRPSVKLPDSATGRFWGIVPRSAIKPAALLGAQGYTAGQIHPGQAFVCYGAGAIAVELVGVDVAVDDPVYLVYSGSDAGKFRANDGGTQVEYLLTLTSSGADAIAFTGEIDGVVGPELTRTSTTKAADAAWFVNAWNAEPFYSAHGVAAVAAGDNVEIVGTSYTAITFADTSGGGNAVVDSVVEALVAPTARLIEGAYWTVAAPASGGRGIAYFPPEASG